MTGTDQQAKYADKIAKLLSKAESTTPQEAELLITKAQELMTQYAIEQALIDDARGIVRDEIEQIDIFFTGNYRQQLVDLAYYIVRANNCKAVQYHTHHDDGGRKAVRVRKNHRGEYQAEVTSKKRR